MTSKHIVITFLMLISLRLLGQEQTENPNQIKPDFDFKFEEFQPFYPGGNLEAVKQQFPQLEELKGMGEPKVYRVQIKGLRYSFPLFFQAHSDGTLLSFYTRLPSYFLHDTLHQALINRFGKQNEYYKENNSAIYQWYNANGMKITYSGSCTITCFPVYINAVLNQLPTGLGTFDSLADKMRISIFNGD